MIPIYKPYLSNYISSAKDAINSEWISNYGKYIELSENKLKEILGIKYCILMNNGTSATQCLFKALKFKYPNIKKIYVPNNVFIAPWNCCLMEYPETYIEVMKMDINTLNIDTSEEYIISLDSNSAVCIVHNLGNIINVPRLKRIRPDLIFIEDNCEGLFGKYEEYYSGTQSLCSAVSFYGNKTITTGEGGAFFTNDEDIYKYIKNIYSHGMTNKRYIHCNIATNFRMTNIQAGFLYDQLLDIDHILELKQNVYNNYNKSFESLAKSNLVIKIKNENNTNHSTWMYSIIIPNIDYDKFEKYMNDKKIDVRPIFYDIHSHEHLKYINNPYNSIEYITNCGVMLPSYPELTLEEQTYIVNCIIEYIN